jgi:hypothetical protein
MKWTFIILLLLSYSGAQLQQQTSSDQGKDSPGIQAVRIKENRSQITEVFQKVEQGIRTGKINEYEKEIGPLISITIGSGGNGYFSTSQAVSVLAGYFSERRPISFRFSKIYDIGSAPYATGRFVYIQKAIQESAQIYVSLTLQDSVWVINQFNIY